MAKAPPMARLTDWATDWATSSRPVSRCHIRRTGRGCKEGRWASVVLSLVLDRDPVAEGRVDGAVTVARKIDRLVNHLLVEFSGPTGHKSDDDLGEAPRPLLLLLTLDLYLQRGER